MDTAIPSLLESFTKSVDLTPKSERLFHIRRNSSTLLLFGFVIIYGLEVYYQNILAPRGTIILGGFWSALYLATVLVTIFRRRKFFERLRAITGGATQQTIRITTAGVEISERNGAIWFIPWILLNSYYLQRNEIIISSPWVMSIAINQKRLTADEINHIKAILANRIKKPDNLPTFRKLFRR